MWKVGSDKQVVIVDKKSFEGGRKLSTLSEGADWSAARLPGNTRYGGGGCEC